MNKEPRFVDGLYFAVHWRDERRTVYRMVRTDGLWREYNSNSALTDEHIAKDYDVWRRIQTPDGERVGPRV